MKTFLKIYGVCLILMELFFFLGAFMLFDLSGGHVYRAGAVIALLLAAAVCVWYGMENRIEALEKEIQALKKKMDTEYSESEDTIS